MKCLPAICDEKMKKKDLFWVKLVKIKKFQKYDILFTFAFSFFQKVNIGQWSISLTLHPTVFKMAFLECPHQIRIIISTFLPRILISAIESMWFARYDIAYACDEKWLTKNEATYGKVFQALPEVNCHICETTLQDYTCKTTFCETTLPDINSVIETNEAELRQIWQLRRWRWRRSQRLWQLGWWWWRWRQLRQLQKRWMKLGVLFSS